MKKNLFYVLALFVVAFITSCGPTVQDAIDYHDKIIGEELAIIDKIEILETEFSTYEPSKIEQALDSAILQVEKSIAILEEMENFDESSNFKDQTLEFFKMFKNQLEEDYFEMLEIYEINPDLYTITVENRYNEIVQNIKTEYELEYKKFTESQDAFAEKYNFTLTSEE